MRRADENQRSLVVDILTKSFDDNKSVNYVVKQDGKRQARIHGLVDYSFNVCKAFGDVWISDNEDACALVVYPDKKRTSFDAILWDIKLASTVIGINRVVSILSRESKIKSFHPKEPFSYLWFIGVLPELQSKGYGGQLLEEIINESERQCRSIYLETSVERNLSWYEKHGFEIFQTLNFAYTLYMLRRITGTSKEAMSIKEIDQMEND